MIHINIFIHFNFILAMKSNQHWNICKQWTGVPKYSQKNSSWKRSNCHIHIQLFIRFKWILKFSRGFEGNLPIAFTTIKYNQVKTNNGNAKVKCGTKLCKVLAKSNVCQKICKSKSATSIFHYFVVVIQSSFYPNNFQIDSHSLNKNRNQFL